jgi:hypothetical protein
VLLLLAIARPPSSSHDLWSYAMYGRIGAQHHQSPYIRPPSSFPGDPLLHRVDPLWRRTRTVYGPVFTSWSMLLARAAGRSSLRLRLGFQLTAAVAVVVAARLLDRRTDGDVRSLALILLNPLVVCSLVNDGHVDAVVGCLVLVAVLAIERGAHGRAGAVLGIAGLLKITALVPAGALVVWLLRRGDRSALARCGVALLLVLSVGYGVGGSTSALEPLQAASGKVTQASVWGAADRLVVKLEVQHGESRAAAARRVGKTLGRLGTLCALAGAALVGVLGGIAAGPIEVVGGAVALLLLLGAYVYPWYWGIAVFAVATRPRSLLTWPLLAYVGLFQLGETPGPRFLRQLNHPMSAGNAPHFFFLRYFMPGLGVAILVWFAAVQWRGIRARPDLTAARPPGVE